MSDVKLPDGLAAQDARLCDEIEKAMAEMTANLQDPQQADRPNLNNDAAGQMYRDLAEMKANLQDPQHSERRNDNNDVAWHMYRDLAACIIRQLRAELKAEVERLEGKT